MKSRFRSIALKRHFLEGLTAGLDEVREFVADGAARVDVDDLSGPVVASVIRRSKCHAALSSSSAYGN